MAGRAGLEPARLLIENQAASTDLPNAPLKCARKDSNFQLAVFETDASADWATRAAGMRKVRFELTTHTVFKTGVSASCTTCAKVPEAGVEPAGEW